MYIFLGNRFKLTYKVYWNHEHCTTMEWKYPYSTMGGEQGRGFKTTSSPGRFSLALGAPPKPGKSALGTRLDSKLVKTGRNSFIAD